MARFVNKGTKSKPDFQRAENESTRPNPHGTAKKAKAILAEEQAKQVSVKTPTEKDGSNA